MIGHAVDFDRQMAGRPRLYLTILFLCSALPLLGIAVFTPDIAFLQPDSNSYINNTAIRTPGYPLLLAAVLFFGPIEAIIPIQLVAMGVGFFYLSYEFLRYHRSLISAMVLVLIISLNTELTKYAFTVLSEAIFVASLAIWFGLILRIARCKITPQNAAVLGAMSAWLLLVRPVAAAFLPCIALLLLHNYLVYRSKEARRNIVALLTAFVVAWGGVTFLDSLAKKEGANISLLGLSLIGKVAFVSVDGARAVYPRTAQTVDRLMKAPRQNLAAFPSVPERYLFSSNFYDYLRWTHGAELEESAIADRGKNGSFGLRDFSFLAILHDPVSYLQDVGRNLGAIWFMWDLQSRSAAALYNDRLNAVQSRLAKDVTLMRISGRSAMVVWGVRLFLLVSFLICTPALAFYLFRLARGKAPSREIFVLAMAGISLHCYYLLTALVGAGLPRYALMGWPLHAVIVMGGLTLAMKNFVEHTRAGGTHQADQP